MSRHKPDAKQRSIFEPRNVLRTYLKRMVIPRFNYVNSRGRRVFVVGSLRMKSLLHVIESHCGHRPGSDESWCFLKLQTIAQEMGSKPRDEETSIEDVDTSTAKRAVAECERSGLLVVERSFYKHDATRYRINWDRVRQIIRDNPATADLLTDDDNQAEFGAANDDANSTGSPSASCNSPSATCDPPSATCTSPSATCHRENGEHTSSSRARGFNHGSNHVSNQTNNHGRNYPDPGASPRHVDDFHFCGWPYEIKRIHLEDCFKVEALWLYALDKGFGGMGNGDRINFFRLIHVAHSPKTRNPGGWLTATLLKIAERRARSGDTSAGWPTDEASHRYAIRATSQVDIAREEMRSGKSTERAKKLLEMYAANLEGRR